MTRGLFTHCKVCGKPVSRQSKKGFCKPCSARHLHADPQIVANRAAAVAAFCARPEVIAENRRRIAAYMANMPEADREARRAHGHQLYRRYLSTPENRALVTSPEIRARVGARVSETRLGWCPPEKRAEYEHLVYTKRLTAAEARAVIEAELPGTAEHARREIASRQLSSRLREERRQREAY